MKSSTYSKLSKRFQNSVLFIAIILISLHCCSSAPVDNNYVKFINYLNTHQCTTPEQIELPKNSSTPNELENLSTSLMICQNLETVFRTKEAQYLCDEIYESLKIALCPNTQGLIKPLNVALSNQVCKDISFLKDVPENYILLKKLGDDFFCDLMCDKVFEEACQVLLWSYQSQIPVAISESANKETIPDKPTEGNLQGTGKSQEPSSAKEGTENAEIVKKQIITSVQPSIISITQLNKIKSVSEQTLQDAVQTQPMDQNSKIFNRVNLESNILTGIIPANQINKNNSILNLNPITPEDIIQGNDLPDNVPAEFDDPHDNGDIFDHNNAEPDKGKVQTSVIEKQISNDLHNLIEEKPKRPDLPVPPTMPEKPGSNPDGFIDPHDAGEEFGEIESARRNPVVQDLRNTLKHIQDIKNPKNETTVPVQETTSTNQTSSSTNKDVSASTKTSTTVTENKVTNTKSSTATENKTTLPIISTVPENKATKEMTATETKPISATENKAITVKNETSVQTPVEPKTAESMSPSSEVSYSVVSPVSSDSSLSTIAIEGMDDGNAHEMPEDREPDQYNGNFDPSKTKEVVPKKPDEAKEASRLDDAFHRQEGFDEFAPRQKYGPDDVPLIPVVFPEQEDGHFFFYFLSMVLIVMAGYLIFHNKQKIIALIVEGRHERRRRSHGAGYKKLETK